MPTPTAGKRHFLPFMLEDKSISQVKFCLECSLSSLFPLVSSASGAGAESPGFTADMPALGVNQAAACQPGGLSVAVAPHSLPLPVS